MRLASLAVLLCTAVPALAQTATPAAAPVDTASVFRRTYSETRVALGFISTTGPFAVGRYSTGVDVGAGVGVGVQAVVGELPYDGLSAFVGAGPEARMTRALPGGAQLDLRAGVLARFGNVEVGTQSGTFGLRSLATTASATVRRPIPITGGFQIVPRLGLRAAMDRRFGDAALGTSAFQTGTVSGVDALVGADVRFRAFHRWWTVPLVVPVSVLGHRPYGVVGF